MNNEPVAWIALNELNGSYSAFTNHQKTMLLPHIQQMYANWQPLYTHPAKTLDLTTDEIFDIWDEHTDYDGNFISDIDTFVRAILRKAQEK